MTKFIKAGLLSLCVWQTAVANTSHLPPTIPFNGTSLELVKPSHPYATEFEKSDGKLSSDYATTMAYLDVLIAKSDGLLKKEVIGVSREGRDIVVIHNATLNDSRPKLLIQAGIHGGEIDGKDAGLMFLRDAVLGNKQSILDKVAFYFIPILNVDGHERRSEYNRINQRGPHIMGFRTNGVNLNLNRDYMKLDTQGVKAAVSLINRIQPDLFLDVHVTDGADYQYDITYGASPEFANPSPHIAKVLNLEIRQSLDSELEAHGHIPGPLVFVMNKNDLKQGLAGWVAGPRYSNGWGDLRALPSILVENHSLKPYKQRVVGTYVLIEAAIKTLVAHQKTLAEAVQKDRKTPKRLVVNRTYSETPRLMDFKGIEYQQFESNLLGGQNVRYLGKATTFKDLPVYWQEKVTHEVTVPKAFYIPKRLTEVIAVLTQQGVEMTEVTDLPSTLTEAQFKTPEFAKQPFEGRFRVQADFTEVQINPEQGAYMRVLTRQPLGKLATHLLHPSAPDSLFQWGFFHSVFQRTEYVENYALDPYASKLLDEKPLMRQEFMNFISKESPSTQARRDWLYEKTPFYDARYRKYPILWGPTQ